MNTIDEQIAQLYNDFIVGQLSKKAFEQKRKLLITDTASNNLSKTEPMKSFDTVKVTSPESFHTMGEIDLDFDPDCDTQDSFPSDDLTAPTERKVFEKPQALGQYHLLEMLGEGGMGRVYRGRHQLEEFAKMTGDVAIKILHPRFTQDDDFRLRFMAEANFGRTIQHPNIVRIYDVLFDHNILALVMDLIEGRPLSELIRSHPMPLSEALKFLTPIAEALDYLDEKNIVHRDIKPANIIFTKDLKPIILDMGIAKAESSDKETQAYLAMGTPSYMAPEQIDAKNVTGAADRYAFAMTLYRCIAGRFPWPKGIGRSELISIKFNQLFPPLQNVRQNVSDAIMKMLSPKPENRFPTCIAFIEALRNPGYRNDYEDKDEPPIVEESLIPEQFNLEESLIPERFNLEEDLIPESSILLSNSQEHHLISKEEEESLEEESLEEEIFIVPPIDDSPIPPKYKIQLQGDILVQKNASFFGLFASKKTKMVKQDIQSEITLLPIPAGSFSMGSKFGKQDEKPPHLAILTNHYFISQTPITQAQWELVMGENPSKFLSPNNPVEKVSWSDCIEFCNKLSKREGLTPAYTLTRSDVHWNQDANGYRLPTEAEWEKAAKGHSDGQKIDLDAIRFSGAQKAEDVAWFDQESTQEVKKKQPNNYDLYDMNGNIWEWCWDLYNSQIYLEVNRANPTGPEKERHRVTRGGSWKSLAKLSRVSLRGKSDPINRVSTIGFRIVRNATK